MAPAAPDTPTGTRQRKPPLARTLSVGELARRSGLAVSAIHFYERQGLIASERNASGHRRFSRATLRVLAVIRAGSAAGIRLEEIRDRLGPADRTGPLTVADWTAIAEAWRADLDSRIHGLERIRDRLTGCVACGCLSLATCPALNPDDAAAAAGPGAPGLDGRIP